MAELSIVKSEPLNTGLHLVKSEPLPQSKQGFVSAFWEGIGGKALMDIMGGASRDPALVQKSMDTLKGLASGLTNEGPRIMKELDSAGEAIRKGDWGLAAHHAAGAAPLFGAAVQNAGAEWERGDKSAAAGHTAALFAPFLASKAPAAARAAADTDAGAAIIGGAKGAGQALIETKPLTVKGMEIPVPTTVASAAAGGQAASMMGLPRTVGTVAGAAAPIVRGAIKGGKAALAERALAKDAASIPPDVMAELTRESGIPEPPVPQEAPAEAQPIPGQRLLPAAPQVTQMPQAADSSFVRSVAAEYPAKPMPGMPVPMPAQAPQRLLPQGPIVPEPPPDGSFVRAVPGEYPQVEQQPTIAERIQEQFGAKPAMIGGHKAAGVQPNGGGNPLRPPLKAPVGANAVSPEINDMQPGATVNEPVSAPPVIDPAPSEFHANGERKSPEFRGQEKIAQNAVAKAKRFAEAMAGKGVTADMAEKMQAGRVSEAQIGKGAAPRWGNLADFLGETEPNSSVPEIIAELRRMEAAKPEAPAPVVDAKSSPGPKSPRDMNRAELAKQAGLPANATTEQIMKALADEMEKDKPKAAAAAKGKK